MKLCNLLDIIPESCFVRVICRCSAYKIKHFSIYYDNGTHPLENAALLNAEVLSIEPYIDGSLSARYFVKLDFVITIDYDFDPTLTK